MPPRSKQPFSPHIVFEHHGPCLLWDVGVGRRPAREPLAPARPPTDERLPDGVIVTTAGDSDPDTLAEVIVEYQGRYAQYERRLWLECCFLDSRHWRARDVLPTLLHGYAITVGDRVVFDSRTIFPVFKTYDASRSTHRRTRALEEKLSRGEIDFDQFLAEGGKLVAAANAAVVQV
jgi:hypothetical protein